MARVFRQRETTSSRRQDAPQVSLGSSEEAAAEAEEIRTELDQMGDAIDDVLNGAIETGVISPTREAAQQFVEVDFNQVGGE